MWLYFLALDTERSASGYDVELFLVVVMIGLFPYNLRYVKEQRLGKESEGFRRLRRFQFMRLKWK